MEEKRVLAVSVGLDPSHQHASLLSCWYIEEMIDAGIDLWVMMRGGLLQTKKMRMAPPGGTITNRVLFVGKPVEALQARHMLRPKENGLGLDLLVLGVDESTPPIPERMLADVGTIMAPPETAEWLRRNGVSRVREIPLPWKASSVRLQDEERNLADSTLHIVWQTSEVDGIRARLPVASEHMVLRWRTDHAMLPLREFLGIIRWGDVYVSSSASRLLDDPIKAAFNSRGVMTIDYVPVNSLASRIVSAGIVKQSGMFAYVKESEEGAGQIIKSILECPKEPEPLEVSDAVFGAVIPFGGLSVEVLTHTLAGLRLCAPPDATLPIVIAHQRTCGVSQEMWDEEKGKVQKAARAFSAIYAEHASPGQWRLGLARNEGLKSLPPEVTHVMFLDADTVPLPDYFSMAALEVSKDPLVALAPYVRGTKGLTRIGSGTIIVPKGHLGFVGGYDDSFEGWGFEDLELLGRLRAKGGVQAKVIGDETHPLLAHEDHPKRWESTREKNWSKYLCSLRSLDGPERS